MVAAGTTVIVALPNESPNVMLPPLSVTLPPPRVRSRYDPASGTGAMATGTFEFTPEGFGPMPMAPSWPAVGLPLKNEQYVGDDGLQGAIGPAKLKL